MRQKKRDMMQQGIDYEEVKPYITKDGSQVRELMHPAVHGNKRQSLAEAVVPAGGETLLHRHGRSEEIYHIMAGEGIMTLGREQFPVKERTTVCIPAGAWHRIRNTGSGSLRIVCCCCPPYSHEDTFVATDVS